MRLQQTHVQRLEGMGSEHMLPVTMVIQMMVMAEVVLVLQKADGIAVLYILLQYAGNSQSQVS